MTSEERREGRYRRRKEAREEKRREAVGEYDCYERIISRDALARAAQECTRGVRYKESVKRFMLFALLNVGRINDRLEEQKDVCKGFICFPVMERGKRREIMSIHFSERVVQKSLNKNALMPVMFRSVIYDNAAGQKGKGTSFARERMVTLLKRYHREHGCEGYVLKIDFKGYFGNIDHAAAKEMLAGYFNDERVLWLAGRFVDSYYEHFCRMAERAGAGRETVEQKGIGLGSEVNQTIAVLLPNRVDHYIKEVLRVKCYVRYMDDLLLVHPSREHLEECLNEIRRICGELRITLNDRKTEISKLSRGFTFLKMRFGITETGKIIRRPCREAVTRTRRVIKRQRGLVERGCITYAEAEASYLSRRASLYTKTARKTVHRLDGLFNELYTDYEKEEVA